MYRILPIVAATISLCVSCRTGSGNVHPAPMRIGVFDARPDTLPNRMTYIGHIGSNYESVVQPRISGYLTAALFNSGMPVHKGQLIFRIDGKTQQANMLSAKAALESARARAIEAKNNYERAVPLVAIDAISQSQFDQYTAEYMAAEASVSSAEQALSNAELELGYADIYAAIDGIISSTDAHVGDFVGPGTQFSTLTTIQNVDTVGVNLSIPMKQYLEYSGRKTFTYDNRGLLSDIALYLADGTRYPIGGEYNYTKTNISDSMGTIIIVVSFPNPDYSLKAGQFARVCANVGRGTPCVVVPQRCISQTQNLNSVWVIRPDSTAEFREVTLGGTYGSLWTVTDGLSAGESVAVDGVLKLRNGMKVVPVKNADYE